MNNNNLKSKVVSFELAKRMKKLGWKKETIYIWEYHVNIGWKITNDKSGCRITYPAPLFCEVWEELSIKLSWTANISGGLILEKHIDGTSEMWEINSEYEIQNINPVETAGNLWCQLKENGYIKEE